MKDRATHQTIEWANARTKEAVHWHEMLQLFQPLSAVGRLFLQNGMEPLTDSSQWQADQTNVLLWERLLEESPEVASLYELIAPLESCQPLWQSLLEREPISDAGWFRINRYLYQSQRIAQLLRAHPPLESWQPEIDWQGMLSVLHPQGVASETYSLMAISDDTFRELRAQLHQKHLHLQQLRHERGQTIRQRYGIPLHRSGELILDRSQSAKIEQAHSDPWLQYVRDQAWETVFRLQPDERLLAIEGDIHELVIRMDEAKARIRRQLTDHFAPYARALLESETTWGRLDWLLTRVKRKIELGYTWPTHSSEDDLLPAYTIRSASFVPGRSHAENSSQPQWTPLTVPTLPGPPVRVHVLIGPNMGGKTTVLRTVALLQLMAQHGLPVPATNCTVPLVDWVRFLGGDRQSVERGLSTFAAEMKELAEVLRLSGTGLLLLDEPAGGTHPQEAEALATALTIHCTQTSHYVWLSTHVPAVLGVAGTQRWRVGILQRDAWVKDGSLAQAMQYQLQPYAGEEVPHDALWVAQAMGLPEEVINLAEAMLDTRITSKGEEKHDGAQQIESRSP